MVKSKKGKADSTKDQDIDTQNTAKMIEDDDSDAGEVVKEKAGGKKTKAKNKKPGFSALLSINDSEPEDDDVEKIDNDESNEDEKPTAKIVKQSAGGKKSKKSKKKNDSDEDLDKVLAELEMEYSGMKIEPAANNSEVNVIPNKKEKKQRKITEPEDHEEAGDDSDDGGGTVKSAAQKKKEKKDRQKREQAMMKQQAKEMGVSEVELKKEKEVQTKKPIQVVEPVQEESTDKADPEEVKDDKNKKKKKKKGGEEEKVAAETVAAAEKSRKGPSKGVVAAMQEHLRKMKEEEERLQAEELEKDRIQGDAEDARLEALRVEIEKKEKKKLKEKERKERLKSEGKLLSSKQKLDKMRAHAMLDALKAQGVDIPEVGEKRPRPGTRVRNNKKKSQDDPKPEESEKLPEVKITETDTATTPQPVEEKPIEKEEEIKEAWDASSSESEEEPEEEKPKANVKTTTKPESESEDDDDDGDESDNEDDDESDDDSENENESTVKLDAERKKQNVRERIEKRRWDAEQLQTTDNLRAAVVCVLGHVDTGKTKILDKLRRTNVQDGEAGGITQQIGATNVPIENVKDQTKFVKNFSDMTFKLPGLLIIDTPGHESFSNLRNRGSSLCDIAILVVDIMHGLEPQTIESLNLLKAKKTPFIVALNKIDRLYDWQTMNKKDIRDIMKGQQANTQLEFTQRTKELILQFSEQGLNAALFYENPDTRSYVSLVPTSAITGEGIGNLLFLIVESCQTLLAKRLMYCEDLLSTVLEVKAVPGLGTTIDAILINGKLREGDTMIVAGTDGPIVTTIRSLLMPQPMKELRVKNAYVEYKEIKAAQGVKIAAKDLEKAIAGLNIHIAQKPDEVEIYKEEVSRELKSALSGIKLSSLGVYVQASTLGSLEALLEFLKVSKIPYAGIRIGPVVKRDVMKASTMEEHDSQYATILAFDVKIERDAQDLADTLGVKIFQADIIYHLFDKFTAYRDELKKKRRDEFKSVAVFPCKLKILPQFIFNSRDPIVMGVMVEAGIVKEGTPICVPSKEFVEIGIVTSIELNHKQIETARKGQEVCIKIEPIPGEAPKMFGRHFEETDFLVSKISRQSIDACKEYFRDDLAKADWSLMVELKKQFQIL